LQARRSRTPASGGVVEVGLICSLTQDSHEGGLRSRDGGVLIVDTTHAGIDAVGGFRADDKG